MNQKMLYPLFFEPVYKFTLWGGSMLVPLFGRTPQQNENPVGEAWEIVDRQNDQSVVKNGPLAGKTLRELMTERGADIVGSAYREGMAFPLLIKLLDTHTHLSIQVHPSKTEMWIVLDCEEGASLIYGLKEPYDRNRFAASLADGSVESLLRRVPVHRGDVFFLPSGMVHAIGGGIVLYEIQQSSDVTYRLWDFNRVNDKGEKRPLHIRQSLDVIDPALKGLHTRMPEGGHGVTRLLDVPNFKLDCACVDGQLPLEKRNGFVMLTPINDLLLCWQGGELAVKSGQSVLLPASCPAVALKGTGRALMSAVC